MKIAIIAPGSQGDVQPYIALGKGLKEAGNGVRIVTHQNFEALVNAHGLECWPIKGDLKTVVQNSDMRERIEKGNFLLLMAQMAKEARQQALGFAEGGLAACQGMDVVLAGMGGLYIGLALAEKLDLPLIQAYLVPFTPTQEFASVLVSKLPARALNRLSHHLTRQVLWQSFRQADGLARRKILGLPRTSWFGPYHSNQIKGTPILYGLSPSVIPKPGDWGNDTSVTGYWFLDAPDAWNPPPALMDFLDAGPKPVYIGFGSMSNRKPQETAELVVRALEKCNQRAILLSGWGGLHKEGLPGSVIMIDSIPHSWLFPRVAAVIHHGGAGTTAAGFKAGVPQVIIPFFGDQPFWGRKIVELGVGPGPIPRNKLTETRLEQAITEAVTDKEIIRRAAALGSRINAEEGVARAVEIIQQVGVHPAG